MGLNRKRVLIVVGLVFAGAASTAALVAWRYRKGERADSLAATVQAHLAAGRYPEAKLEADKLVRIANNDADAHLLLAKSCLAGRDPGSVKTTEPDALKAVRELLRTVGINPGHTEAQRMVLAYYAGQRNYTEAMPYAQEILRATPEDSQANYMIARALVQLNRPLDARKHLERLVADEKARLRPRTAALSAAVGEGLGKEGQAFVTQADEALAAYMREKSQFETVDDCISLVELRCWKAHRPATPPDVVRTQLTAAVNDLDRLVKDHRSNDMLPGFVLDAVKQIVPREGMNRKDLKPVFQELQASIDRVTTETFNLAVERKILDPRLYTAYGERLRDKGQEDEAAAIVKKGVENSKNASDLVKREFGVCDLWLAKHYLAQKRNQDAKPHIDALIAHADWKPWGQLMQGYSLVLEEKFDVAAPPLQEAVQKLGQTNGAAHALYGLCMLRRGFISQGREHLERGKALGADGAQFRAWLTLALAEAGETQAALQMAKEIIAGAGGKSEAVGGVSKALEGELRMRTGDLDGAEGCLAEAVKRTDPKLRSAVRLSQAQLWMSRKDWPKAKEILDEVKQDENFAYRAFANESRWLQQNGDPTKASEVLAEGRRRFPNNGLLLALHVTDLTTQKKFDDAREVLNAERKRQPEKELPYLLLSEVFDAARKPEQAIDVLQQAVKQFPKEASIKLRLVDKLIDRNRTIEIGPIMAELEGDANVNPSAIEYLKARRAVSESDPDRAAVIVAEALKRDKNSPLLRNLMGLIERNKGNIPGAIENFRPSFDQNPTRQNTAMMFDTLLADGQITAAADLLRTSQLRGQSDVVPTLRRKLVRLLAQREQQTELERELAAMLAERPSENDVALAVNLYQGVKQEEKARMVLKEALARAPESLVLNEVDIAMMLDRKDGDGVRNAHEKIAELFRKSVFLRDPTLHALRARAFISKDELNDALTAVEFGLGRDKAPGNPALAALKVQVLLRMKRDSDAEAFAVQIKKDFPQLPPAKYLLARAYEALGNTERAFTLLGELAKSDPSDANAAHHFLRLLISRGQFGDLEPSIEQFIAANASKYGSKENPLLLGVLAEYHATRGDVPKAQQVLKRLEKTQDGGVVVPYLRGVVAFAEGNLPVAEKALQLAMTDPAGHIPSTFLLSQIRAQEGRLDDSLKLLGRIAKSPDSPAAVPLLRASLMVRTGKFEDAESACRDYLKLNPSARPFRQLLTQVLLQRGTDAAKQEALSIAETSLEQGVENPLDFEVYLKVLILAGRTDKALQVITDQALTKNRPELILAGGRACYSAGQYREAERYAKKLVGDEPHNLNAKLLLGDSLMRIGDIPDASRSELERTDAFEKAAAQYRDVLKAQPTNMIAANNLAWVIGVHLGRPHRAIEELQTTFKGPLSETDRALPAEVLDTIGFLHLKMDHYSDAQRYLEEAAVRKPSSAEIQVHLGETYLKQDRSERAKQCFDKARQLDSKGEFTSQIQRLMLKR